MTPAATYVRASTEHQRYSTANQAAALEDYAARHGFSVIQAFEDDGRSGLDFKGRPGLRTLIQQVLEPDCPFRSSLVYDVSRWGRFQDPDEAAYYEFMCRRAGVRVIYCAETFDNDGSFVGNIAKALKRNMAAEYSRELSEKVAAAKLHLASLGYFQQEASFGLRRGLIDEDGHFKLTLERGQRKSIRTDRIVLVPGPPEEVAIVRLIFRLFVKKSLSFGSVATELNRRMIPTPAGMKWNAAGVKSILRNDSYVGDLVYGRTWRRLKATVRRMPPETWIRVAGAHKGIVSRPTFTAAQRRMKVISERRPIPSEVLLSRLRALFEREGYLSPTLIKQQSDLPRPEIFTWRFGGLINAYRAVGYLSPRDPSEDWDFDRIEEADRKFLLRQLRDLLERRGYLSAKLIDDDPELPAHKVFQLAFGSLYAAYDLIGYKPPHTGKRAPRTRLPAAHLVGC